MEIEFSGKMWYWRGPSPFYFVTVPAPECDHLRTISRTVTYGWGMIPVVATIGDTQWKTSLFPKNGGYIVPIKDKVRKAEALDEGAEVRLRLQVH